jgi:hypothetical protein
MVVLLLKRIDARLLLEQVGRGGLGGLLFQSQVHPLVAAILLWVARINALDPNAQSEPHTASLLSP